MPLKGDERKVMGDLKTFLGQAAARLPRGARETLFTALCNRRGGRYATFIQLANEFNVVGLKVAGENGLIQSDLSDTVILGTYAKTGRWARRNNELLKAFFGSRQGGTYVDVGANIGLTTIPLAQNRHISCIAIEPEPRNFSNLIANVAANCPHDNVELKNMAVFSERTLLEFEIAADNFGDHRIRVGHAGSQMGEKTRRTITVQAAPLDEIVTDVDEALAVKIDTQGAEPFVFEGGRRTLARAGCLIAEFWPYGMACLDADADVMIRFLRDTFDTVSLGYGESESVSGPFPARQVAADLERFAKNRSDDSSFWLDVIAYR